MLINNKKKQPINPCLSIVTATGPLVSTATPDLPQPVLTGRSQLWTLPIEGVTGQGFYVVTGSTFISIHEVTNQFGTQKQTPLHMNVLFVKCKSTTKTIPHPVINQLFIINFWLHSIRNECKGWILFSFIKRQYYLHVPQILFQEYSIKVLYIKKPNHPTNPYF